MPDPLNPESTIPAAPLAVRDDSNRIVCEYCECRITKRGEIIEMGDKAKRFRKLVEENEKLQGTNDTLRQENEELKRKVSDLTPAPSSAAPHGSRKGVVVSK